LQTRVPRIFSSKKQASKDSDISTSPRNNCPLRSFPKHHSPSSLHGNHRLPPARTNPADSHSAGISRQHPPFLRRGHPVLASILPRLLSAPGTPLAARLRGVSRA